MRASSCLINGLQLHKQLCLLLCLCFPKVLTVCDFSPLFEPFTSAILSRTALENNWQNLFAAEVGVSMYGGRSCTFVTGGKERA